jgi:hypothetical protein
MNRGDLKPLTTKLLRFSMEDEDPIERIKVCSEKKAPNA